MNRVIKDFMDEWAKDRKSRGRSRFNPNKRLKLTHVYEEPAGWPLIRPATPHEWAHALKVMIMRRVPKIGPIHRDKLMQYVSGDLEAASATGRIYVDSSFRGMRRTDLVADLMCHKDKTLRMAGEMKDPDMYFNAPAIYRTQFTDGWLKRVPVTVTAIVDFLPITSVLDLMVQALIDDD